MWLNPTYNHSGAKPMKSLLCGLASKFPPFFLATLERSTSPDGATCVGGDAERWRRASDEISWGKQQQRRRGVVAQTWRPSVARNAQTWSRSPQRLDSVASDIGSSDTPTGAGGAPGVARRNQGGGEYGASAVGCDGAGCAQRLSAGVPFVCDSGLEPHHHHHPLPTVSVLSAPLSGLSHRPNHQPSGMWVNSGTVGR